MTLVLGVLAFQANLQGLKGGESEKQRIMGTLSELNEFVANFDLMRKAAEAGDEHLIIEIVNKTIGILIHDHRTWNEEEAERGQSQAGEIGSVLDLLLRAYRTGK